MQQAIERAKKNHEIFELKTKIHRLKDSLLDGVAECTVDCTYCEDKIKAMETRVRKEIAELETRLSHKKDTGEKTHSLRVNSTSVWCESCDFKYTPGEKTLPFKKRLEVVKQIEKKTHKLAKEKGGEHEQY